MKNNIIGVNNGCTICNSNECNNDLINPVHFSIILELDDNLILSNKQVKYMNSNKNIGGLKK
jgi:hypothetical protein